jgi:hypothetical protein
VNVQKSVTVSVASAPHEAIVHLFSSLEKKSENLIVKLSV